MTKDEALKEALEALSVLKPDNWVDRILQGKAWDAVREALAPPAYDTRQFSNLSNQAHGFSQPVQPEQWTPEDTAHRPGGLAQPEQEPVAWGFQNSAITGSNRWMMLLEDIPANDQYGGALWTPLYTSPPQRQPLTDAEIMQIELGLRQYNSRDTYDLSLNEFARAIEAKLKEKNNG